MTPGICGAACALSIMLISRCSHRILPEGCACCLSLQGPTGCDVRGTNAPQERAGIDSQLLSVFVNDSDCTCSQSLWHKVFFFPFTKAAFLFSFFFFKSIITFSLLLCQHIYLIPSSWSLFSRMIIYFPLKVQSWVRKKVQQRDLFTGCKSNTNLLCEFSFHGMCFASKNWTNAQASVGDSRRGSSGKPT